MPNGYIGTASLESEFYLNLRLMVFLHSSSPSECPPFELFAYVYKVIFRILHSNTKYNSKKVAATKAFLQSNPITHPCCAEGEENGVNTDTDRKILEKIQLKPESGNIHYKEPDKAWYIGKCL